MSPIRGQFALFKELSKSGIVALVLISVLGGYLAGHRFERGLDLWRLVETLLGILFLASGSSALNQYQERQIDASMKRTSGRPIPSGRISLRRAQAFIALSLLAGLLLLAHLDVQLLTLGLLAVVSYNGLYTLWWKPKMAYAAIPGAIPGALPILMGYVSASGKLWHPAGWFLFFILFFWQMPHFWVLALKYREDYQQGGFPTLPVARGTGITVAEIVIWCLAYVGVAMSGGLFMDVGAVYWVIAGLMSLKLLWELRAFAREPEGKSWLRFFLLVNFSLILYIGGAVADLWSVYLVPYLTR